MLKRPSAPIVGDAESIGLLFAEPATRRDFARRHGNRRQAMAPILPSFVRGLMNQSLELRSNSTR